MKQNLYLRIAALMLLMALAGISVTAQTQTAPRIFASDLQSGPNSGGQGGRGAWVTVFGSGFGTAQGSSKVTIGGSPAAAYALWSDKKIAFQLGSGAASGNIVVSVGGVNSNPVPFTVRSGKIYFVSPQGNDSRQGTYSRPWRTLAKAAASMRPGDIAYAMNGTSAVTLSLTRAGASGKPFAIVSYPNATVTVGSTSQSYAVTATNGGINSWVLSGLMLRAAVAAVDITGATDWRLVGDDISCPNGSGTAACVLASSSSNLKLLANKVHDTGSTTSTDVANYASVQLSASNVEVGWNEIGNTRSCRALAFSSSAGNLSGLTVHDNYIHDAVCDGISFANVDASAGAVTAYNNIIQHVGTGPAPAGVERSYSCVQTSGSGSGTVQLLNNTLFDCGAYGNSDSGAIAAATPVAVTNDIVSITASEQYLTPNTSSSMLSGSNDLFWGQSYVPAPFSNSLNADPQFIDAANSSFALQSSSPAIDAGANTGVATDYASTIRPQGKAFDIGAYEFAGTVSSAAGQLTESPTTVNFGTVTTGTSNTQSVTVTNAGTGGATISQMNVTGAGFSASGLTLPMTLAAGQSTSLTVTYAPQISGTSTGSVALVSNASDSTSTVQLTGNATSPAGTLNVPGTLSFGNVTVGTSATQNVTVTASTASVTISQANVTGTGFSVSGLTLPATIAAGQSATFQVKFAPTTAGTASGSLSLVSNASNSPSSISLSGSGVSPAGTLSASPTSLSFGNVTVGTSATQNVTVTASTASVTISQANVTGAGFAVSGLTLPATIAAGQSATFQVKFSPTAAGSVTGSVSLVSNASATVAVSLSGTGTNPTAATPSFSPAPGSYSSAQSVTISDSTSGAKIYYTTDGSTPTTASTVYTGPITVSASEAIKAIAGGTGFQTSSVATGSYTIAGASVPSFAQVASATPQSSQSAVSVSFPGTQTAGDLNIVVVGWNDTTSSVSSVKDSAGNTYRVAVPMMRGTGLSQAIYYATNIMGGNNTVTVTFSQAAAYPDIRILEYKGLSSLDVTASAAGTGTSAFSGAATTTAANELVFGADTISTSTNAAGAGFTARILTSPDSDLAEDQTATATGSYTATAGLSSGYWVMQMVTFKPGSGSSLPVTATPTFSPAPGTYSSAQSVTISDATSGAIIHYTTDGSTPTTSSAVYSSPIPVGTTTTIRAMAVASGSQNSSVAAATFTISGTSGTAHSATLNWSASSSTSVVGYNVYRSTQSGGGFTKLNSTLNTGTTYVDNTVSAGATYYYVVTSVDGSGNESGYSNQVTATIPTP